MDSSTAKLHYSHTDEDAEGDVSLHSYTSNSAWARMRILGIHRTGNKTCTFLFLILFLSMEVTENKQ